jgi:hypothetical protein
MSSSNNNSSSNVTTSECDNGEVGDIDWINNACSLLGNGETIVETLWIIAAIFYSAFILYALYRCIGVTIILCMSIQSGRAANAFIAHTNGNGNNRNTNRVDLTHLRLPSLMAFMNLFGTICGLITCILHLQGQRISVDVAISISNALIWTLSWLNAHAFIRFWIHLGEHRLIVL